VVNIFVREITDELASLVKQIDDTVGKNEDQKMAAFVVLLTDNPSAAEDKLKAVAEKNSITNTPLTVFSDSKGPGSYKIADDADITVMMWVGQKVKANHALSKGELTKEAAAKIVADTAKILE
jgi:hypothetical protein